MGTITIKDIAEQCGVAVSTVSRAINNHPDINKDTRAKIMKTIKENNFVPNDTARNLKRTVSQTIAVVAKAIDNPFFSKMIRVFEKEINQHKYSYFLQHVDENEDEVEVALQLVRQRKVKGIIFLGGYFVNTKERLTDLKVPFVVSTISVPELSPACVYSYASVHDEHESYRMTKYLLELGHKKIAFLGANREDQSIGKLRLQGYLHAMEEAGIRVEDSWTRFMLESYDTYSMRMGYEMMKKLLEEEVDITAVYAISDIMAIGACKAIFKAGKSIPEDYSVAGFDGLDSGYFYEPSITTIEQPVEEIAKESIQMLFHMILNKKSVSHKLFECKLQKRESVRSI